MVVEAGERQSLLGRRRAQSASSSSAAAAAAAVDGGSSKFNQWTSAIRGDWNVYQIALLMFLYQTFYYGQVTSMLELVRDLTCSRYYELHPDLINQGQEQQPCGADVIESQSAQILLLCDLFTGLGSALSTMYFGKKFATWGRKPILLMTLSTIVFAPLIFVAVPRAYPYGPIASKSLIRPINCLYLVVVTCAIFGLLGGNSLSSCCFRILMADHSDTADRTKNLLYLAIAYMCGITFGPLFSGAASYLFPISASGVDGVLQLLFNSLIRLTTTHGNRPTSPPDLRDGHGIVTPFIVCILGGFLIIVYVFFFVEETAFRKSAREDQDSTIDKHPSSAPITPLRALFPIKLADGTWDWRITALFMVLVSLFSGSSVFAVFLYYFGHTLHWSQSAVGYVLSSVGACRLVTMFLLLPPFIIFLEKTIPRPAAIAGFTVDELHQLSKGSSAEETPIGESAFTSERDLEDTHLLQGAIAYWKANIDLKIIKVSWGVEIIGWLIVVIGATYKEAVIILIGEVVAGLGTGGAPALQSFGLAVTSDVLAGIEKAKDAAAANEEDEEDVTTRSPSSHGHAGEIFFSVLAFGEGVTSTFTPIIYNSIYAATLSSLPGAPYLLAASFFASALFVVSLISVHRHRKV